MPRPKKEKPNRSDGRYEYKLTLGKNAEGKPVRKSFYSDKSKEDAKEKADEWKTINLAAEIAGIPIVGQSPLFKDWAEIWLEKYKRGSVKESTYIDTYERTVNTYLVPYFGKMKLSDIKPVDIKHFYKQLSEKYYESTLKKARLCLMSIFETAIDNDKCYKNPAKNESYSVKNEGEEKRTYTQAEVDEILEYADTHRYGLGIRIMLELGLRCSELCGLKWTDIDYDRKTILIQRASTRVDNKVLIDKPKSKNSIRELPLSTVMINQFKLRQAETTGDYMIITSEGKPFTATNYTRNRYQVFWNDFKKHRASECDKQNTPTPPDKRTEIKQLSPHELRHTCGTLLYENTKDIYAVSKYLGHADVQVTTKYYVHEDVDTLRNHLGIN